MSQISVWFASFEWESLICNDESLWDSAMGVASSTVAGVVNIILGFVITVCILLSKNILAVQINKLMSTHLKPPISDKFHYIVLLVLDTYSKFLSGQCVEAILLGILIYYNSGVMLIDLIKARKLISLDEVFQCINKHRDELLLPDQDVFNFLYGKQTLPLDDAICNYDARRYSDYLLRSNGDYHMDWVMKNTVILHFCEKSKPWKTSQINRFVVLYKHYMRISCRK